MMDEFWETSTTPQPSTPTADLGERPERSSTAEAEETEPFAQAESQITELMQRFVEEVRTARRDAQVAANSARTADADAERIRQEAVKLRADAEADAIRVTDNARAEADRATRSVQEAWQEIDRASRDLGAMKETIFEAFRDIRDRTVATLGEVDAVMEKWASSDPVVVVGDADEPATPVVVVWDADEPATADVSQVPEPDL